MVTEFTRLTTLAQYKTALERAELAQRTQTQELETTRKANIQLTTELQAAKISLSHIQQQLAALQQSSQADLAIVRKDVEALDKQLISTQMELAKAQAQLATAQAEATTAHAAKDAAEAQASLQLTEAGEIMSRLKLAAVAAADREIKLGSEINALRKQIEQVNTLNLTVPDASEQLAQLRRQIDALVVENRRMAESLNELTHDRQALATALEGHQLAQAQAVEKTRTEVQLAAQQQIDRLRETVRLGQARLTTLTTQLQSAGKLEVLAPDQVGALMSGFLQQLEGGMPSLRLAEGELKLKLGLASAGQTQGFVILQPDAKVEARATVHEVALKFDRSGELRLPLVKP
jgi:chromosome segregation ATPase